MITKQYVSLRKNGSVRVSEKEPGQCYWATWRPITAGLWDRITARMSDLTFPAPSTIESRTWRLVLKKSNLFGTFRGPTHGGKFLTKRAHEFILNLSPPQLLHRLVQPVLESVRLTPEEENRIKLECHTLWSGRGSVLKSPHPLMEEAVECMNMSERYGIVSYSKVSDIPQRTLTAMRLISATYSDLMEMNRHAYELREQAARQAGLRGGQAYSEE